MYNEEAYLQLSGVQHFLFCPRQWALIHIEQQWSENVLTTEGTLLHQRAHDPKLDESRKNRLIIRAMPVFSPTLGIRGVCDVVEFFQDAQGVPLAGRSGLWIPRPVEYKHGVGVANAADAVQLCLQAMCLEEMLGCRLQEGDLYYASVHRREAIAFTEELRKTACDALIEMHRLFERGYTPRVRKRAGCRNCSLSELCLPVLQQTPSAKAYIENILHAPEESAL